VDTDNRAEFSSLDESVFVYAMQSRSKQKQSSLKLKTWPEQLLGSLPLAFVLPASFNILVNQWGSFNQLIEICGQIYKVKFHYLKISSNTQQKI
jgi:hypothetical protein